MEFEDIKKFLLECDNVSILTHKSPDGDTFGSAFALCRVLRGMGKKANVLCSDGFPKRYDFLYEGYVEESFDEKCVIAVDIADTMLIGSKLPQYTQEKVIDLCIDHHVSNKMFAKQTYVDADASATAMIMFELFKYMQIDIDKQVATCLYTGIATDTGCFKYENTTRQAHIAASELMSYGIEFSVINRKMFDVKSKSRLAIEQIVTSNIEFYFNDRVSVIVITKEMMKNSGADDSDFEGLAAIPLSVEGVDIGITVKQRHTEVFKISVRTTDVFDASLFCRQFGGGGHIRAAGCEICGTLEDVKRIILKALEELFQ